MALRSKLPAVGTTIFTIVSQRAAELGAINLGQGFPDYEIDPQLSGLVFEAMQQGHNQYAPMPGLPRLRQAISEQLQRRHGVRFDPDNEITITLGATEALFSTVQALLGAGEEAVVFDPAYDSYEPAIALAGGRCVHIPLAPPDFAYDWDRVRAAIGPNTRLIIINSPQNPGCSCLTAADLDALAQLAEQHDLLVLSDEVYEHMVFDGQRHQSVLARPGLRERAIAVFSFGKTLHATGLRVGYAVASAALTRELRKVHQFNTFTIATPLQWAIARYMEQHPNLGADLAGFFAAKRDRLIEGLAGSGFATPRAQGSFFQLLDYSALSNERDLDFCERLLTQGRVASIPLSVFYREPPPMHLLRLCIAKREAAWTPAWPRCAHLPDHYKDLRETANASQSSAGGAGAEWQSGAGGAYLPVGQIRIRDGGGDTERAGGASARVLLLARIEPHHAPA